MEEFRKKVEKRLKVYGVICCSSMALFIVLKFITRGATDFAQGLTFGIFIGLMTVAIFNLARMYTALHNEDKFKEMYINEIDERNIAIQKETSQKGSLITMTGIALAALAAGFFDEKICITLALALVFGAVVNICVTAYYNKKM